MRNSNHVNNYILTFNHCSNDRKNWNFLKKNLNVRVQFLDCAKSFPRPHQLIELVEFSLEMFVKHEHLFIYKDQQLARVTMIKKNQNKKTANLNVRIQLLDSAKPLPKFHQLIKLLESLGEMSTKYQTLFITKGQQLAQATMTKKNSKSKCKSSIIGLCKIFPQTPQAH